MDRTIEQATAPEYVRDEAGERLTGWIPWLGCLAVIIAAEFLVTFHSPQVGIALHLALLFILPVLASFGPREKRSLWLSLVFAPLIRVVSLTLPLSGMPPVYWYVLTSLPLFVAFVAAVHTLGLTRRELGMRIGNLPVQLAIGLVGIPLGVAEFYILRPAPLTSELTWQSAVLPAIVLLLCTGFLEEFIFRGLLQTAAGTVLGHRGLVYVSAIFAALHIGYLSALDVAFVFGVGLAFAWFVLWTRSLLGVSLAHGLTNITLLLVVPLVGAQLFTANPEMAQTADGGQEAVSAAEPMPRVGSVKEKKEKAAQRKPSASSARAKPTSLPTPTASATRPDPASPGQPEIVWQTYIIQQGDNLTALARRFGTTVQELVERNRIPDPNLIYTNSPLQIPRVDNPR